MQELMNWRVERAIMLEMENVGRRRGRFRTRLIGNIRKSAIMTPPGLLTTTQQKYIDGWSKLLPYWLAWNPI